MKLKSFRFTGVLAVLLTASLLSPTSHVSAAEQIQIPESDSLSKIPTERTGTVTVSVDGSRDIRVRIDKQTEEGVISYYNTLLTEEGSYAFTLDCNEYDIDSKSYFSDFLVTILDEKDSGCAFHGKAVVHDVGYHPGEITASRYTWDVASIEGETRDSSVTELAGSVADTIYTERNTVYLQYIDYTLGDVDNDGNITLADAYQALMYSSLKAIGKTPAFTDGSSVRDENAAFSAADVDKNLEIELADAYKILMYNSIAAIGGTPSWD